MDEATEDAIVGVPSFLIDIGVSGNWLDVLTFSVAIILAIVSIVISLCKKNRHKIDSRTITLDLMRGASLVPLSLFVVSPLFPHLGQAAVEGNTILLSLGAANGVFTLLSDWYQNT